MQEVFSALCSVHVLCMYAYVCVLYTRSLYKLNFIPTFMATRREQPLFDMVWLWEKREV